MSTTSPAATAAPSPSAKPGSLDVPKPGGRCAASGRTIEPGEKFIAAVRETPVGLERLDVSAEHWNNFDRAGLLAFWQTTMPASEQKKKKFVDDEVLCTLFERLADTAEPVKINFRFVLGLLLMRKRLIIYEDTRHEDGRDVWVVRLKGRNDKLDLVDPKLDEQ